MKSDKTAIIHANIEKISALIKTINIGEKYINNIADLNYILSTVKLSLNVNDERLLSEKTLDELCTATNTIHTELRNYKTNTASTSYIDRAIQQIDTLLNSITQLKVINMHNYSDTNVKEINEQYQKLIITHIDGLNNKYNEYFKSMQGKFESQQKIITEQEAQLKASKESIANIVNNSNTLLDGQRKDTESKIKEFIELQTKSFKNLYDKTVSDTVALLKKSAADMNEKDEEFKKHLTEIEKIRKAVSQGVMANSYDMLAEEARKRAKFWNITSMIGLIVTAIFAGFVFIYSVIYHPNQSLNTSGIAIKLFTITTIAAIPAFAARQASKQEKIERYSKDVALQLATIDSFLINLDPTQQKEIKQKVANELFGCTEMMKFSNKNTSDKDEELANIERYISIIDSIKGADK